MEDFEESSFQGPSLPSPDSTSDGEGEQWLVLRHLQKDEVAAGLLLRPLRPSLGAMHGTAWCPSSFAGIDLGACCQLARLPIAATHKESQGEKQTEVTEEMAKSDLGFQRSRLSGKDRFRHCLLAYWSMGKSYAAGRLQGVWEGLPALSFADGISTAAPTAPAHGTLSSAWGPLDASNYSWCATCTFHAASPGFFDTDGDSADFGYPSAWCSTCDAAEAREQCTTEAAPYCKGFQEGRPPLARVPGFDPCRDEEGRQGEHQRPLECRPRAWQSERISAGSGKCTATTVVTVASVFAAVRDQMERVHGAISVIGNGLPVADARGHRQLASHTATGGHCQEEGSCPWHRRCHCDPIGRRDGRDGAEGGRGNATRRECSENRRRAQSGGQQPFGVVRVSRSARAQTEKATQRPVRTGKRSFARSYLLAKCAFWQARCCVTNAYQHQGLVAMCDPHAVLLHWGHTVLQESFFVSPWRAIESAQDLAIEVGAWGPLRCENFVLPPRHRKAKAAVSFADVVEVLQGEDCSGKFLVQTAAINDFGDGLFPRLCPGDTVARRHCSSNQASASSSTPSLPASHFLDRRLSQDVPGYIHHLQHLWRDSLLRQPDGQPYVLRTWYLHHIHQRVWTTPREVSLPLNHEVWHTTILNAWRDQLHNDEALSIAVVFPEVRALRGVAPTHADLVLTQGSSERAGGITTVFPPTDDAQASYTWATSLSRHVSGLEILTAVNADAILQSHACDLFHGGLSIPTTSTPSHWMQNGHSFVAVFQDLQGARDAHVAEAVAHSSMSSSAVEAVLHHSSPSEEVAEHDEPAEESSPLASSSFDEEDLRGLHVFGLAQPAYHCFVRWTTYTNILLDVLRVVGLHRDLAIGFHHVQVPLIDQHTEEEAIVLQRVGDIPPGAPDQLIVVDIIFEGNHEGSAPSSRQVHRFPRFACRSLVLQLLGLDTVCLRERSGPSCLLFFNRVYWDHDDDAPREFTHGAYIRVIVLPMQGHPRGSTSSCDAGDQPNKRSRIARAGSPEAKFTPTGSSLIQVSVDVHGVSSSGPRVHSALFPSLASTNVHTSARDTQVGRALPPLNEDWKDPLRRTFYRCAVIEFPDEGPVQYWTTWFLHHDRYLRNTESRVLRLDRFSQHWSHDLRNLWGDMIDQSRPAWIHLVLPNPPDEVPSRTTGHLLLVQGHGENIPTLLTALFDHPTQRRLWRIAAFVPQYLDHSDAVDALTLHRWCSSRRCTFQAGNAHWPSHELVLLQPGEPVTVTISPLVPPSSDITSMMQLSSSSASSSDHYVPDPVGEVLPSPRTTSRTMSPRLERYWREQMTEIFERDAVIEMEEEGPVLYVWTWFINHQTDRFCKEPVAVRLHAQADQWWDDILHPWAHMLRPGARTHIDIVSPRPWTDRFRIDAVHLMIEQHPSEPFVAGIITTFFHETHGDRVHQSAHSLPRWLCTNDLINHLGINHMCDIQRCTARAGIQHFEKYTRHDVYTAISIEVHVQPPRCDEHPSSASVGDVVTRRFEERIDSVNLLQLPFDLNFHAHMDDAHPRHERRDPRCCGSVPDEAALCDMRPTDKIDGDYQQGQQEMQRIAFQNDVFPRLPPGQPPLVNDLHHFLRSQLQDHDERPLEAFLIAVWYADHDRRPHSGLSREVRLPGDLTQWYHDIIMAWDDWIDPFAPIAEVIVHPTPLDGQADVLAHIVLVQHVQPIRCSVVVAIVDSNDDPWHPRLLCLTVPCFLSHEILCGYVDLDRICVDGSSTTCRTYLGDRDLTDVPQFEAAHGMHLTFHIRRTNAPVSLEVASDLFQRDADSETADDISLLQRRGEKITLSLDQQIQPSKITTVDCQKVLFLRAQIHNEVPFQPEMDLNTVWWHESTWYSLASVPMWQHERALGFTFYTDGSAWRSHCKAAAGTFLLVHTDEGLRCGGFLTAKCLGSPTAPRAEATALILAALWMRQLVHVHASAISWLEIAFDCEHTANIAQGIQIGHNNCDLSIVLRSLVHWLEILLPTHIKWTHHRSHQGDPWNEAADSICRHAIQNDVYNTFLDNWFETCTFQGQDMCPIQWLWLVEKSVQHHPDAPSLVGTQWHFDVAAPFASWPSACCHPAVERRRHVEQGGLDSHIFDLKVATANVLTLFPGQEWAASYFSARAEGLAEQFLHEDLHVVGLQETRSKASGHSIFDAFHVLSAPATKRGHGGVQLWMRKQLSTACGKIDVEVTDLCILHATSQRLIVRWAHPGCHLLFVVLHAPTDEDDDVLSAFWDATTEAIPRAYRQWKTIVLADANSRLGSVTSTAVGSHEADEENGKGAHFHGWLLDHSLFLPQTFAECHTGESSTWTHPAGAAARIDFVAVSTDIPDAHVSTWVSSNIDLALHRKDHDCVCAQISLAFFPADRRPRDKRTSPTPCLAFDAVWPLDVHTHAAQLQHWIRHGNPVTRRWRKRHLSADTRTLVEAKRFHWKRCASIRRHVQRGILRQVFDAWKQPQYTSSSFSPWIKSCDMAIAWHSWAFADLAPRVVQAIRDDDRAFYEQLTLDTGIETSKGCRRMWAAIQHALPRWRSKRRSNLRCTGPSLEAQFQHYDALEAGHGVTYEDLLATCHEAQRADVDDIPLQIPLSSLPSRLSTEVLGCRISTQKAPGIDSVAPVALQHACQQRSDLVHQLMLKVWILGAEPLQGKGGLLHPIAKKQVSNRIEEMRGIMLIDGLGKLIHSFLRGQFIPVLEMSRLPLQLGGFARSSTLFATIYIRAFTRLAALRSLSSAVVFVDIRSAFHSMVRQLVFGGAPMHPKLMQILAENNIDVEQLVSRVAQTPPLDTWKMPQTTARLLRDSHRFTWYTLGASEAVHQTERGSRPGSPLADVAFNSLMTLVLKEVQIRLNQQGQLQMAFQLLGLRVEPVAWVDDLAVPVVAHQASALVPVIQSTLRVLLDVCSSYGLQLNLQPRKTEVVPTFRGTDATVSRQECLRDQFACISIPQSQLTVRCTPLYEHLGTMFQGDGGIEAELRHRTRKARLAYKQVHSGILRNRHIDVKVRLRLLEALIMPILFHGAGNWPLLGTMQVQRLHAMYLKWIRSLLGNGFWAPGQLTDTHILLQWSLPTIALRLAKHRLLFAFHLLSDAPQLVLDVVTAVADTPRSWFQAVRHALLWATSLDASLLMDDPMTMSQEAVIQWFHDHRQDGPRWVRRLYRRALHQGAVISEALSGHHELKLQLEIGGATFSLESTEPCPAERSYECQWCAKEFATMRQWQNHMWSAHGEPSDERRYMTSTTCPACWTCFWTINRLQIHLRQSRRHPQGCYERLTWLHEPLDSITAIDEVSREERHLRLPSAVIPHVMNVAETQCCNRDDADRRWQQACRVENFVPPFHFEGIEVCKNAFDAVLRDHSLGETDPDRILWKLSCIADERDGDLLAPGHGSWTLALWFLDDLRFSRFLQMDVTFFGRCMRAIRTLVQQSPIGRLACWKRRMDTALLLASEEDSPLSTSSSCLELEPILDPVRAQHDLLRQMIRPMSQIPVCCGIPIDGTQDAPIVWILHLFSGRRRTGDCHWWLERIGHRLWPEVTFRMVSLDTAVHPTLGNLATGPNVARARRLAEQGLIAGVLTGPPCETWSAARHIELDDKKGPRPLRSAELPWSLTSRTGKEMNQTSMGTQLLTNSWTIETAVVTHGGAALMEHPWEAEQEDRASVWRTDAHQTWLMQLPGAYRHYIQQYLFGSKGVKPTCLRALNLGDPSVMKKVIQEGMELWRPRPTVQLAGRNECGAFRTAEAKEYPSALCRTLIVGLIQGLKTRASTEGFKHASPCRDSDMQWLRNAWRASAFCTRKSFLPDFQGT